MRITSCLALVVGIVGIVGIGCSSTLETYSCENRSDCIIEGNEGICEESGVCSFLDLDCESGRRYGKLSGDLSNLCVQPEDPGPTDAGAIDAGAIDGAIDAGAGGPDAASTDAAPSPDAGPSCPLSATGFECPATTCPSSPQSCCPYGLDTGSDSCNQLCGDVGMQCDSARLIVDICASGGAPRSCLNMTDDLICYCF